MTPFPLGPFKNGRALQHRQVVNADTQFVFGYMHDKGLGVPQSNAEAVKWYRLAAKQDQALAQAALGSMFSLGRGVPPDYIQAHIWLSRAISRLPPGEKHNLVTRNRSVLAVLMTPAHAAEARILPMPKWEDRAKK